MATLLSDADVGFAAPKLLSDEDVGFKVQSREPTSTAAEPVSVPQWTERGMVDAPDANIVPQEKVPQSRFAEGVSRVEDVASKAWKDTPSVGVPAFDQSPLGQQIVNPAMKLAAGVVPGPWNPNLNAGMAALSQAAMEVFGEKGGRDALALLTSLPMINGERLSPKVAQKPTAAEPPRFVSERTAPNVSELDPRNAISELIQHDIRENPPATPGRGIANQGADIPRATIPDIMNATDIDGAIAAAADMAQGRKAPVAEPDAIPGVFDPGGTAEASGARSGGAAATPGALTTMPVAEMKANRRQAEMQQIMSPARPGDKTIYVEGSLPTLAEYSGDPAISQREVMLRQRNPSAFEGEGRPLTDNMASRVAKYEDLTPSDTALYRMAFDRSEKWKSDVEPIAARAKPADLQPAVDWLENILSDPRVQERDEVRSVFEPMLKKLYDQDGNLKTDARAVWGMHDNLQSKLLKSKDITSAERYVIGELNDYKKVIDGVMNEATDNQFQVALDNFAEASKAINSGELLRDFRPKLTNAKGDVMAQRFHKFVVDIAEARGHSGIDPAMDISDATMAGLIRINEDLKRAGLIDLGKARGSPTDLFGTLARGMGIGAAHLGAGMVSPGMGNVILHGALNAGENAMGRMRLNHLTKKHLAPPEGGYTRIIEE